jgi:molybdopterin/thiamine biosynthesis adenylyltransferase
MRDTKVLLIGMKSLHAEVCKNLVLAGVQSVTLLDQENVTWEDLGAHIFLSEEDVGKNVM